MLRFTLKRAAPLLRMFEQKAIKRLASRPLSHEPIFIVGAPRTGSTILYQMITHQFDVSYIDNLTCLLHKALYTGFRLSNRLYGDNPHNTFHSRFGSTIEYSLHAPSECGEFWYRWLPRDHHYIETDEITEEMVTGIRTILTAVTNHFGRPLVINNNNAGLRVKLYKQIFPDAKWIMADRDPYFIVQSILKTRHALYGNWNEWWSLKPKGYEELLELDPIEQVVRQVYEIIRQTNSDLHECYPESNYTLFEYEQKSAQYRAHLAEIADNYNFDRPRLNVSLPEFTPRNQVNLPEEDVEAIREAIQKYDWNSIAL